MTMTSDLITIPAPPDDAHDLSLSNEEAEAVLDAYSAAVVAVADRVSPSVVNISLEKDVTTQGPGGQRVYTVPGGGSGVIIAPDGYILSNSHVVHDAKHLEVTLADGRVVRYLRRRFLPDPATLVTIAEHRVGDGDRTDNLAAKYLGDPLQSWRMADANLTLRLEALVEEIGRRLRFTLPEGVQGPGNV